MTLLSFSRTSSLSVACLLGRSAGRHEPSGAQHCMCWTKARSKHRSLSIFLFPVCMGSPVLFRIVSTVNKFFRDHSCDCALASAAPLLCFQLKRYEFNVRTGAVNKLVTPVSFTEPSLQVPIWEDVSTLQTKQVCYRVSAIAFHEGRTPYAGHYRTCLLHQGCHYITDDNTEARMINPQLLRVVQSNSYLFLCHLQPQD